MPRILDNIDLPLLPALQDTLRLSERADFCVGYFNLRGWRLLDTLIDSWCGGEGACCRVLVGMQALPSDELRTAYGLIKADAGIDNQTALRLKKRLAEEFREQLSFGAPSNTDEPGLRRLSVQIKAGKVVVKLFLRHPLHAKLYLLHRQDPNNPTIGFLGSSNLTLAGLAKQGELNVDVLDHDACQKLQKWFDDRWQDRWCLDISEELAQIIDSSWAREKPVPPYHIYLKMAYHLSQEARAGLSEFRIPRDFGNRLFDFQAAAVKIAARHTLHLPRYGLENYLVSKPDKPPSPIETKILAGLSRAGNSLMGFGRTNLFKSLESGGPAFIQSIERHILRNSVFLYALENDLNLPLGTQEAEFLDAHTYDEDADAALPGIFDDDENDVGGVGNEENLNRWEEDDFQRRAAEVYQNYASQYKKRFKWLRPTLSQLAILRAASATRIPLAAPGTSGTMTWCARGRRLVWPKKKWSWGFGPSHRGSLPHL